MNNVRSGRKRLVLSVSLDPQVLRRVKARAKRDKRSVSHVVELALVHALS